MNRSSPWGQVQDVYPKAEGIEFISTASHGGYHLSPNRQKYVKRMYPEFTTYAGGPWYEEDQDCAVVVLTFPELYKPSEIYNAVKTAESSARPFDFGNGPKHYPQWEHVLERLESTEFGRGVKAIAARFEAEVADQWQRVSMGSCDHKLYESGIWWVSFTRVSDKARRTIHMPYPEKQFYTSDELDALDVTKPAPKPAPAPVYASTDGDYGGAFDGFTVTSDADPGF